MFICDYGDFIFEEQSEEGVYQSAEDYQLYETVEGEFDMSETRYGFTKMSVNEFKSWLQKQEQGLKEVC